MELGGAGRGDDLPAQVHGHRPPGAADVVVDTASAEASSYCLPG